jgi:NAD(P)-dependent dehydrogenase (short-subunit alcohol dehydrogenase family)/DNA-binding MarR family transcriptional regulator
MRLGGTHALVTGGGSGIGAAIARTLARDGAALTLVGRRREPLEALAAETGAAIATADVADAHQVAAAFAAARAAHGPVTILVNNAGVAPSAPFHRTTADDWRRTMAVNADALFHCCQAALPDLRAAEAGRIVTIASTAGLKGYAYTAAYVASKHAAIGLTRALAVELAATPVTVNAVCPGFTDTAIVADAVANIALRRCRARRTRAFQSAGPPDRPAGSRRRRIVAVPARQPLDHRTGHRRRRGRSDVSVAIREKHDGELADRSSVRLWLRLLSCATVIEKRVKRRLTEQFDATLPRFDVMAQLDRADDGMTMGALSSALLVSNGNVTGVVQVLARDGLVALTPSPTDGRVSIARLTDEGRRQFAAMAAAHHDWIEAMLAALSPAEQDALYALLGKLKQSIAAEPTEDRA